MSRALRRRYGYASLAASKKRFDALRAAYLAAGEAARDELITQSVKYGTEREARSWASRGEKTRLEKLEKRRDKAGDALTDLVAAVSPRGEAWKSGVPIRWIRQDLTWDDVVRPAGEPLSAIPPPAFGWSEQEVRHHLKT